MNALIESIFSHESLVNKPPVLLDIGASGDLPEQWKLIAPYSIGIAFDADDRDFSIGSVEGRGYKKLYNINRIVAPESSSSLDFYLTKSPYCSSALPPDIKALDAWAFQDLFTVEKVIQLPAVDLNTTLKEVGVDRIDWYKTDSQGTDLRIFKSLPKSLTDRTIVADFEPGILNGYQGEDMLYGIMAYMQHEPFWVSNMHVKGPQRIHKNLLNKMDYYEKRAMRKYLKESPGWCEIDYMNKFDNNELTIREYLLGWIFATIKGQHGFAMHIATLGGDRFDLPLFDEMFEFSNQKIKFSFIELSYVKLRRLMAKLLGRP